MTPIFFTALAASLMALSGQPAWAERRDCLCRVALDDAASYASESDVLRHTDYDWDADDPGVASVILQARAAIGSSSVETVDIGVTEQRISFDVIFPHSLRARITPSEDSETAYFSYLFCRWSRPADRLYEIGLAYSEFSGGRVTGEVSAYVPSDLLLKLQQRCDAAADAAARALR